MDCRHVEFSPEKSQTRIDKALEVFPHKRLILILAFSLHLLGAKRKEVAALAGMPEESVKTALRRVFRGGFPALRDRRESKVPAVVSAPVEPEISVRREGDVCIVDFGASGNTLRIPASHRIQGRTVVLSLVNAGVLRVSESATALGISGAHCRELAHKLAASDVADALIDKRVGQKLDYRVGPEQKAEIIQQLAARAITGHRTSSEVLAEYVSERTGTKISARTVRWHIRNLGLTDIRKTLSGVVESLKKTPADCS